MSRIDVPGLGAPEFRTGDAILHVVPPEDTGTDVCRGLLTAEGGPCDVLQVAYGGADAGSEHVPTGHRQRYERVVVGRSPEPGTVPGASTTALDTTTDLAGLGIAVGERVERLAPGERPLRFCFRGVGAVFDRVEFGHAFEFFHVLTRQLSTADAISHFHLDPDPLDDGGLSRFGVLFDAVVREDADGGVAVER